MTSPVTTTILFVDDDQPLIDVFRRRIEMEDARVKMIFAMDGEEAMDILRHENPDLLITNINMPKMDGYQLIKNVRKKGHGFPIIVLTNLPEMNHKEKALELARQSTV